MNVLRKLNAARKQFHERQIKKTGYNDFAKYEYFELGDFLVPALQICESLNLSAVVSFGVELATMTLTDLDDGSQFVITSPMSTAKLKACHEVQNLGAVQTYLRRYLWVAALEIVEHDALNMTHGKDEKKTVRHSPVPDVELTPERRAEVDRVVSEIVTCFDEGLSVQGIVLWYAQESFADNDERTYAWKQLAPYSKIRSEIKANKPTKENA